MFCIINGSRSNVKILRQNKSLTKKDYSDLFNVYYFRKPSENMILKYCQGKEHQKFLVILGHCRTNATIHMLYNEKIYCTFIIHVVPFTYFDDKSILNRLLKSNCLLLMMVFLLI